MITFSYLLISINLLISQIYHYVNGHTFDPKDPAKSGYSIVFSDDFYSHTTIDSNESGNPNFNWYVKSFFTPARLKSPTTITINDGIATLNCHSESLKKNLHLLAAIKPPKWPGAALGQGAYMATAMPSKNRDGWVGRAFSGGAFFEARIAFNPADINHEKGWPAFWSIGLAHLAPNNQDQWPGEVTGYKRFLENDFFEYATARFAGRNSYGATLHDWHGIYNKTCASGYCDLNNTKNGGSGFSNFVITPARPVNWTEFHTIGQLWVPSKANGEEGYIQNYFDGKLMSRISWNKSILTAAPPSGRTVFNIADTSNLVLILSTGENQPMHIDWVHVWQLNSKQDER